MYMYIVHVIHIVYYIDVTHEHVIHVIYMYMYNIGGDYIINKKINYIAVAHAHTIESVHVFIKAIS
jgi:hypothetical protein